MAAADTFDVAVLGAGAAGLFCAAQTAARGLRTVLIESGDRPGRKILISGGGRCNFTNLGTSAANYLSKNPHFAKSALRRYTPQDFLQLVNRYAIPFHEKTLGQLFCNGSSQAILSMLQSECRSGGVEMRLRTPVQRVEQRGESFRIITMTGAIEAGATIIATGGLSIPKLGASGIGYDIARSFGLRIVEPRAALVPFTFSANDVTRWSDLAGLSMEVVARPITSEKARSASGSFREKMLITHRGLSGPAILQVSSYWRAGESIEIDLVPYQRVFAPFLASGIKRDAQTARSLLREHLPGRFSERWLQESGPPDWKNAAIARLEGELHRWCLTPAGTEGFAKAEITAGGIDTDALSGTTMQAKAVPGLAFIGEVVDVTGWLGGYNFQWAWASAYAAASAF